MNSNEGVSMFNPFGVLESFAVSRPRQRRRGRRSGRPTTSSQSVLASQKQTSESAQEILPKKAVEALEGDNQREGQGWIRVSHSKKLPNGESSHDLVKMQKGLMNNQAVVASPIDPSASQEILLQQDDKQQSTEEQRQLNKELDDEATKLELTSPEGFHQIILWIQMLKSSIADYREEKFEENPSFYHAFIKSRVLEIITKSILEQEFDLGIELRKEILLLFDVCLLGSSSDHEWLYRTLRTVSTTAKFCSRREELFQLILTMIQSIKKHNPAGIVSNEERLKSVLELSSKKDSFDSLSDRAAKLGSVLVALERSSGLIPKESQSEQHILSDWRLTFHIIKKKSELMASSVQEDCEVFVKRKTVLEGELENRMRAEQVQFDRLFSSVSCLKKRRSELQEQHHRLVEQLQFVKESLLETESLLEKNEQLLSQLQDSIDADSADLKVELNQVVAEINTSREGMVAVEFVQAFAHGLNHRLVQLYDKIVEGLNNVPEHAECLEKYLVAQHCLVEFLDNRIKYCQRRMLAASEETSQFESLGIHRTGMSALEEQMRAAVQSDQRTMRQTIADVQLHIARAIPVLTNKTASFFNNVADLMQANYLSCHFCTKPFLERYCRVGGALKLVTANAMPESGNIWQTTLTDLTSDTPSSIGDSIDSTSQHSAMSPSDSNPASECPPGNPSFVHSKEVPEPGILVIMPVSKDSYSSVAAPARPEQQHKLKPPIRRFRVHPSFTVY